MEASEIFKGHFKERKHIKALTEQKWNLKRIMAFQRVPDFNTHFFKYKLRLLGAKMSRQDFSLSLFSFDVVLLDCLENLGCLANCLLLFLPCHLSHMDKSD